MKQEFVGSDFEELLANQGVLEEAEAVAVKRVLAFQLAAFMKEKKITKGEMSKKMQTSRVVLDRLLDPENCSVTLHTMSKAAQVLGKHLRLTLE